MKTVKKNKYLTSDEACWYVGVDEKFLIVFVSQGKLGTLKEDGTCYYRFDDLNRIKDTLADDFGGRKIATECEINLEIGKSQRKQDSWTNWASAVSIAACLVFVLVLVFNFELLVPFTERQQPSRSVHSEMPQSVIDALPNNIAVSGNRAVMVDPLEVDENEEAQSVDAR